MGETETKNLSLGSSNSTKNGNSKAVGPKFFVQLHHKLQNCVKSQLQKLAKDNEGVNLVTEAKGSSAALGFNLERQLQVWRENPKWVNQPPEIKVSVPKGSLCNLNMKFDVGLPPDAVYNIVTDPDNRRVFKNIKEVISRRVLLDDGNRQLVEVEQAALWKFLWWSGTFSVHVLVDQNRQDLTMKFKQVKSGFMKTFEGCWTLEPIFVDENICHPFKPKTWEEYCSCTGGKGRIASKVSLEQLIQPSIVPPPPISWYLRGITTKTTEMMANDLIAEAARITAGFNGIKSDEFETSRPLHNEHMNESSSSDIKERWAQRRRNAKKMC